MAFCAPEMRLIDKWRSLPPARRRALVPALATVLLVRLCLPYVPLRMWKRVVGRVRGRALSAGGARVAAEDIAWAVCRASRDVPGATCLTQALSAQLLLSRRGYASLLRIGVTRAPGNQLRAHAWLESNSLIVVGGADVNAYTPLAEPLSAAL